MQSNCVDSIKSFYTLEQKLIAKKKKFNNFDFDLNANYFKKAGNSYAFEKNGKEIFFGMM